MKPRDVGNGLVCASFGADGRWLSLGSPHPGHGFVELNALPRFDPSWRVDPPAVRRYRSWMTEDRYAFLDVRGAGVDHTTWAHPTFPVVVARYRVCRDGDAPDPVVIGYRGTLDRPAYAEITDISPLPELRTPNRMRLSGNELRVEACALPATATITVEVEGARPAAWSRTGDHRAEAVVDWIGRELVIAVSCSLHARDG